LRRLFSPFACTGGLRSDCSARLLSSRAVCIPCGLRRLSCNRLAVDITIRLAPSCYILQSSCPAHLLLSPQPTPVSYSHRSQLRACAFGCALWPCFQQAIRPLSARTGDQLQLSSRAAHLARLQRNSRLAPGVTRVWQRRLIQFASYPAHRILRLSWRPVPGSRWLPHFRLAPFACRPYFRSLSLSAGSWLIFRLAPDPSSLILPSCDSESRRTLVIWACGLNRAAHATRPLSQACDALSTSTGPCIVS